MIPSAATIRTISAGSSPVSRAASATVYDSSPVSNSSSMYPNASRPSSVARRISFSEWPRSRSLATILAWLTTAGDQLPS